PRSPYPPFICRRTRCLRATRARHGDTMTFLHKLSHRLARLRGRLTGVALTLLATTLVGSCEKPLATDSGTNEVAQFTVFPGNMSDTATVAVTLPPVSAVSVSPPSATVSVGQTAQLTATPKDASGTPLSGRAVTWSSSDTTIARVSGSGLVTAIATGSATIT